MPTKPSASPPEIDPKLRRAFHHSLPRWYHQHQRDLPWRRTRAPYAILVSEFMLQQTRVATVIPYHQRWMQRFPNWSDLARASELDVLKAWEGLGYYRRARHLHQLAIAVTTHHNGRLPADPAILRSLPGIGPYIAGAVASIAFDLPEALVDGNVERVFARVFHDTTPSGTTLFHQNMWARARALVPAASPGTHNQSLMELGALICLPRKPRCPECPLRRVCRACLSSDSNPESLPVIHRAPAVLQTETLAIIIRNRQVWLENPGHPGRWPHFHRIPAFDSVTMTPGPELLRQRYTITKYRVTATILSATFHGRPPRGGSWIPAARLPAITLPAPHRKILEKQI